MTFKPRVLVVDDDPFVLEVLAEGLTRAEAEPCPMESSPRAAEVLNKEKFDGVFLDWLMPGMDGLELARQVRWSNSNSLCPIVMITGNAEPGALGHCFRAGVNFFLQKPVSLEQVQKITRDAWDLMLQERLRYQRVPVQVPVVCTYHIQSLKQESKGETVNLSTTGMCLRLDSAPAPGSRIQLTFRLPRDSQFLLVDAVVVRLISSQEIGVRLINLVSEVRWRLMGFSKSFFAEAPPEGESV